MKHKLHAFAAALAVTIFCSSYSNAQTCGTKAPSQEWEKWFQSQVADYVQKHAASKSIVKYTIPIIVHILHNGETYGTFPNVDSNQIKSQISALNADYAGIGTNASNVPSQFANLKSNTGIQYCLAAIDHTGSGMVERGCDRINVNNFSWPNMANPTLNMVAFMNGTVIPVTIWPPDKYLNIWISDRPATLTINGFATYPSGSTLPGLFAGNYGSSSNDGIWIWTNAFGTIGSAQAPVNGGRTLTHQTGHWLGLRHIWGDGNCLSDYVGDTPPQKNMYTGCPNFPIGVDNCGTGQSPNGEMFMNFMDETNDACKYMFTHGQNLRMQTALNQAPLRFPLGSHGICTPLSSAPASSAVASFTAPSQACLGSPWMPFNTSSGHPNPSYLWSSNPGAQFSPNSNVPSPMITFGSPGTYTISLVATNSLSSSTYSMVISSNFTCNPQSLCLDSIRTIKKVDTLVTQAAPYNPSFINCQSGKTGHLVGTNCYKDREFAQYFHPSTYTSIPFPQVNSLLVLFDSAGTEVGNSAQMVYAKIYGGTSGFGPSGVMGTPVGVTMGALVTHTRTSSVSYVGKPGFVQGSRKIIAYRFDFTQPIIIASPGGGFFGAVELPNPNLSVVADSVSIYHNTKYNSSSDSSAWFMNPTGAWRTFRNARAAKIQLAIIPQITCSPIVGLKERTGLLGANVTLMPNPGSGLFTLVFSLAQPEKVISIRVFNSVGQAVIDEQLLNVGIDVLELDLRGRPEGIYFAEISNGTDKVLKKIVLMN
jgi:hypothetical protein